MKALRWSEGASADIFRLVEQAEADQAGVADRLFELILSAPQILCEYPGAGATLGHSELRKWLIKKTPFLLIYRERSDEIEITRVLHRASDWASLA